MPGQPETLDRNFATRVVGNKVRSLIRDPAEPRPLFPDTLPRAWPGPGGSGPHPDRHHQTSDGRTEGARGQEPKARTEHLPPAPSRGKLCVREEMPQSAPSVHTDHQEVLPAPTKIPAAPP